MGRRKGTELTTDERRVSRRQRYREERERRAAEMPDVGPRETSSLGPHWTAEQQRRNDEVQRQLDWVAGMPQAKMLQVPRGTAPDTCGACGVLVYRIVLDGRRPVEVDCSVKDGMYPSEQKIGYGLSHIASCGGRKSRRA